MLFVGLLFKVAPNGGAEVLSSIPNHKKTGVPYRENTAVR